MLHDIGKAVDHEVEGPHIQIGADLAKKYKESPEVVHAILAHHGDIEANTVEAVLVQAADAISAAGQELGKPGGLYKTFRKVRRNSKFLRRSRKILCNSGRT